MVPGLLGSAESSPTSPVNGPVLPSGPSFPQDTNASIQATVADFVSQVGAVAAPEERGQTKHVFKEIGPVAGGFVIQDEDEVLYRATRL